MHSKNIATLKPQECKVATKVAASFSSYFTPLGIICVPLERFQRAKCRQPCV